MRSTLFLVVTALVGCAPVEEGPPPGDFPVERTAFEFQRFEGLMPAPRWGATVVERGAGQAFLLGGVADRVLAAAQEIDVDGVRDLPAPPVAKYCGCPLYDSNRGELIFMGGRNGNFADTELGHLLSLESGVWTQLEDSAAFDFPVGCQAFFDPVSDRGYVFGGLSGSRGAFGSITYRYEPETRTFVALDVTGPAARYDAVFRPAEEGGPIFLIGGMGRSPLGVRFFSDVWTLDPETETWTEIATTSQDVPPGRRYPWVTFAPDNRSFLYGFGSDSPMGSTVLGDLWRFELESGTWSEVDVEGERPSARGFTWWLPGPANTAGLLFSGYDGDLVEESLILLPPTNEEAGWH